MIYTIPNFQNPSGCTMSLEKRKALYALALKHNVIILRTTLRGAEVQGRGYSVN